MSYRPNNSVADPVQDMAAVAIVTTGLFRPNTRAFRANFWDVDINSASRSITCRLSDGGGLQTTGYNMQRWDKENGAAYAQTASLNQVNTTWLDPFGASAFTLIWGYWEGWLMDPATNEWTLHGVFRDNQATSLARVEVMGQIILDSPAVGAQFQSANALNWDAGKMGSQSWT